MTVPANDDGSSLSRRERLKQERKERILDAAAAVFARKGYHETTIRDIAEVADVADGTIYNYFENKFDLLLGIMARIADGEQLSANMVGFQDGDVRGFFIRAFHDRMERIELGEEMLQAILPQVFVHPDLRDKFYQEYILPIAGLLEMYIQSQIDQGYLRPVDVPLTTRVVQGMFLGLLLLRILGDEPLHEGWEQVPELLATLIFDGLDRSPDRPGQGNEG